MAAVTPQTIPWIMPVRGSSDGVNDREANTTAPQRPGTVRPGQRPRRRVTGAGGASVARPLACGRGCGGTATPVPAGSALSDMLGLLAPSPLMGFAPVFLPRTPACAHGRREPAGRAPSAADGPRPLRTPSVEQRLEPLGSRSTCLADSRNAAEVVLARH